MTTLHPIFADMIRAFAAMPAVLLEEQRSVYEAALIKHDWQFEFSDDHAHYTVSSAKHKRLKVLQTEVDADGAIWNRHAPKGYRISTVETACIQAAIKECF